jgi:spore coat polysaccharide biosynthesis protein SpsF (cytidylyltransferase family)
LNAVAIICSRIESRRVPGKALMKIAGVPVMRHILNRLRATGLDVIVAVPGSQISQFSNVLPANTNIWGGWADSPLHRMAESISDSGHVWCVRVTHDDPLIDAKTVIDLLDECDRQGAGYGCTPTIVEGAGVEVIHRDNLLAAAERRKEPTEYVSYFVRGPGMPRPGIVRLEPRAAISRPYRLTLDYPEDALVLEAVLRAVGPNASLDEIVAFLDGPDGYVLDFNRLPELSIYTCAYNASPWVYQSIKSAKLFPGSEYIFVNDGSTDRTLMEAALHTPNVKILSNEENIGLASSSNRAISECRGRMVMRLDADDYLDENACEHLPKMMEMIRSGFHVVYPAYNLVDEGGRFLGTGDPRTHHHVGGAIFDKAFLNELRFKEGLRNWDGLELYQRMKAAGARIGYYDTPTWCYRQHGDSMSRTNQQQREKERDEILKA